MLPRYTLNQERSNPRGSKRVEKQIADIQGKSEKKKLDVRSRLPSSLPIMLIQYKVIRLQTELQQQQAEAIPAAS
jgi:hypothetical protein